MLVTIFALSCDSENNNVVVRERPSDYFPLQKGAYQVYEVNEKIYTLGVATDQQYQLKTVLVDSIEQEDGSYTYVQYHFRRSADNQDWIYASTWAIQANERELLINEANTVYLKLRFPPVAGYRWNGNRYNNLEEDEYVLEEAKANQTVAGINYSDCLVINQEDNQDRVVFLDQRKEVYARNIGLLSKEVRQLHYCTSTDSGCLGQQVVEEGVEYTQILTLHGQE